MLLLNSVLIILVLEKVGGVAMEFAAVKPIVKAADTSNFNADQDVIVKISPDAIFKSFRAVVSSDYLRNLAEDFAQKAAAHFLTIINGTEEKTFRQEKPPNDTETTLIIPPVKKSKYSVSKQEVLVLLREPAIDGDNLGQTLSDEITETTEGNTVRLKINGAYYKRHNRNALRSRSSTEEPKTTNMMDALKTVPQQEMDTTTEKSNLTTRIPTRNLTTHIPTRNLGTQTPTRNLTTQIPTRNLTTQIPTSNLTTQIPTRNLTAQIPTTNLTTQIPTRNLTTQIPTRNLTTQIRTTNLTTQIPTTTK